MYQNVNYTFQTVLKGALKIKIYILNNFEGILKTATTKTSPRGRSATNFISKGGSKKLSYILEWSYLKLELKVVMFKCCFQLPEIKAIWDIYL